jgi:hypothetical protein
MPEQNSKPRYRATSAREAFDEPLEWRVDDADGNLICTLYDEVIASRIAAALVLAEEAEAGADIVTLADAVQRFKEAKK